ncbi:MAG: GDP-mannose 4,6-dehydratase [Candidatus Sumerlaeota bacterium]|nr:GDP-mannose 4,6-dehydratase [Candidatus Sumerlaeota bacterium]
MTKTPAVRNANKQIKRNAPPPFVEAATKGPILITGAGGFIGSHVVEAAARRGMRVRAFVRYNSRNDSGLLRWIDKEIGETVEVFRGDLRDPSAAREAVAGCATVIHLAALIAIPYSYLRPMEYLQTNVLGTANVLDACREAQVRRVVITSTSEVYGSARYTPIDEGHPLQAQSPYAASKIAADKLAESYGCAFGLPVVIARPFNTFGPRQSARAIIPTIIAQALSGGPVRLGSLEPRRDLNFVADTAEGMLRCAETPGIEGETFNLGRGEDISIGELARNIVTQIDARIPIESDARRVRPDKSEVIQLLADSSKARERLGWTPQTSLDEGLRLTIEWYRQNAGFVDAGAYGI